MAAAARGELPRLLELGDLRGFLHCHTNYSDGSNSVEELALACRAAGYQYVGITDHSQAAAYAGGLKSDDLLRQADEIDEVNGRLEGIRVLKGVEADILADGRVDFEEQVLARLDFVIASIHSRFNMSPPEMTARMLAAMDNPYLTIIGHPTGRLLLSRDPYGIDLDAVIEKAAAHGVALEINADPHRLDLDWRVLRRARDGRRHDLDRRGRPQHAGHRERGVRRRHGAEGLARPGRHPQRPIGRGFHRLRQAAAVKTQEAPPGPPGGSRRLPRPSGRGPSCAASSAEYPDARCALDHGDAYQLLVATILSAQCTDARVNMVTPAFFARYPSPEALARADRGEVEEIIRSTGFFRNKTRSLIGMAQALVADHRGEVPRTMERAAGAAGGRAQDRERGAGERLRDQRGGDGGHPRHPAVAPPRPHPA